MFIYFIVLSNIHMWKVSITVKSAYASQYVQISCGFWLRQIFIKLDFSVVYFWASSWLPSPALLFTRKNASSLLDMCFTNVPTAIMFCVESV